MSERWASMLSSCFWISNCSPFLGPKLSKHCEATCMVSENMFWYYQSSFACNVSGQSLHCLFLNNGISLFTIGYADLDYLLSPLQPSKMKTLIPQTFGSCWYSDCEWSAVFYWPNVSNNVLSMPKYIRHSIAQWVHVETSVTFYKILSFYFVSKIVLASHSVF